MKIKATKSEIKECIINAMTKLVREGKTLRDENDWEKVDWEKRSPKRQKMKPQPKEKYKGNWEDEVDEY